MKSTIKKFFNLFRRLRTYFFLKIKRVKFNKTPLVYGNITVKSAGGSIRLGNGTTINSSIKANPVAGVATCFLVNKNAELIIGENCRISNTRIAAFSSVQIDNSVYLGAGCCIYDTDFHPLEHEYREKCDNSQIKCKPVHIKEHAFIGANSIILKGVTIGVGAVIGAGSIVTKDVPDFQVWAGNPAKFIKNLKTDNNEDISS